MARTREFIKYLVSTGVHPEVARRVLLYRSRVANNRDIWSGQMLPEIDTNELEQFRMLKQFYSRKQAG